MLPLTELGHSRQGQISEMGGVKWVSKSCVGVKGQLVYHLDMECSCPPRGTYMNYRGVALYPSEQPDYKWQCTRLCSLKQEGVYMDPWEIPQLPLSLQKVGTLLWTDSDSSRHKKISIDCIVKIIYSTVWSVIWLCCFRWVFVNTALAAISLGECA